MQATISEARRQSLLARFARPVPIKQEPSENQLSPAPALPVAIKMESIENDISPAPALPVRSRPTYAGMDLSTQQDNNNTKHIQRKRVRESSSPEISLADAKKRACYEFNKTTYKADNSKPTTPISKPKSPTAAKFSNFKSAEPKQDLAHANREITLLKREKRAATDEVKDLKREVKELKGKLSTERQAKMGIGAAPIIKTEKAGGFPMMSGGNREKEVGRLTVINQTQRGQIRDLEAQMIGLKAANEAFTLMASATFRGGAAARGASGTMESSTF